MVAVQAEPSVLLVGELGSIESDLALAGFACAHAGTANDAVNRLKSTRIPVVVVPSTLQDMGSVEFIQGVLRYFDSNVVLFGVGADQGEVEALVRTGRVAHLPQNQGSRPLVEMLARALPRTASPGPSVPGTPFNLTPAGSALGGLASSLFSTPTPQPRPGFGGAGSPFGGVAPSFQGPGGGFPSAASSFSSFPPSGAPSFPPAGSFPPPGSFPTPGSFTGSAPRPPTLGPTPGFDTAALLAEKAAAQQKLESLADELANARAEIVTLQQRSAMQQVAEVMALSEEGDPITEEIEEFKKRVTTLEQERDSARAEATALREDRDQLVAEGANAKIALAEADARAASAATALKELEEQRATADAKRADAERDKDAEVAALKELAGGLSGEVEHTRAELDRAKAELEQVVADLQQARADSGNTGNDLAAARAAAAAAEQQLAEQQAQLTQLKGEHGASFTNAQARIADLEQQVGERDSRANAAEQRATMLEAELADARNNVGSQRDLEGALRVELDKTRAEVAAARTDATTARLDLQEAMMRLDEAQASLEALKQEASALRAEAEPLRQWTQQVVTLHATQQAEIERQRAAVATAQQQSPRIGELEKQLEALQAQLDKAKQSGGGEVSGDTEVLLARARQLAALVGALEPFMWGLTQATGFFSKHKVDGADDHVRLLQQLQGVLLRLRDEIAMLDLG